MLVDWCVMGLTFAMALAEPKPQDQAPPPDSAREYEGAAPEPAPEATLELLEFLGSWETATGQWTEAIPDTDSSVPLPDMSGDSS